MATELLRPGVSVIQEFRTVSPTVVTPTLVPCAVGPAFQILEAFVKDATGNSVLNPKATASVGAVLTARNPGPYTGLHGKTLKVSVNGGVPQEFTFSDPTSAGLSAAQVVDQINSSTSAPTGFGAYVSTVGASSYLQLRSVATGDGQTLKVLTGTANSVLGFLSNEVSEGSSSYKQYRIQIEQNMLPDPHGNLDELDVDEKSIRVFVNTGTKLKEMLRTTTFLRSKKECVYTSGAITFPLTGLTGKKFSFKEGANGSVQTYTFSSDPANVAALVTAMNTLIGSEKVYANGSNKIDFVSKAGYFEVVQVSSNSGHSMIGWTDGGKAYTVEAIDDGNGDSRTPFIIVDRDNFAAAAGSAKITGSVAISSPINVHNKTFRCSVDGRPMQEVVFDGGPIVPSSSYTPGDINGKGLAMLVNGVAKACVFSGTDPIGMTTALEQINAAAGVTVAYISNSVGQPNPSGDRISFQVGGGTPVQGGSIVLLVSGTHADVWDALGFGSPSEDLEQTCSLDDDATGPGILSQINATFGTGFASESSDKVQLLSSALGAESKIEIGSGTANSSLGFTTGATSTGQPFPAYVGDAVYGDGSLLGYVTQVCPGGYNNRLKLDREVALTFGAASMYIEAKNLDKTVASNRPTPDLVVTSGGSVILKHDFLRDTEGYPVRGQGSLVIAYKALRLDVTPAADRPSLITVSDTATLEEALGPINPDNPLALQLYFMLINATGTSVTGLGVSGVSEQNPDGTPEAYAAACDFLRSQEVYALAPTSQDPVVHQIFAAHVSSMSEPDNKGERIVLINPKMPGEAIPVIACSGTDGDSTPTLNEFDTKLPSLATDVLHAGVNPVGTIPVSAGLFLTIASSQKRYSISSISGTLVTIRTAFSPGENDDNFYAEENFPTSLVSETFAVKVRGKPLVTSTGKPDYDGIAQAYQDLGRSYSNRRVIMVAPEYVHANIDKTEQKIKGYYLCGAIAGMIGRLPPQQPFTNYPIAGFTGVSGSNDVFTEHQMNVGAAGGTYWVVQEIAGAPLSSRHQLTTDLTSIETRELSITKVVDFVAKFMRAGLRNFIGKFNVTQSFLDTLSMVCQGQLGALSELGVIIDGDLNNIVQDEAAPDTVLVDVTLDVPYPCNYIRLTLVI